MVMTFEMEVKNIKNIVYNPFSIDVFLTKYISLNYLQQYTANKKVNHSATNNIMGKPCFLMASI